ncbi:MAG: hypothetical protein LBU65_06080 [Planctomycetaceae bacterium]|jgi:hypothetical protein|nr:hypothetical protein [Planctomycetaceae bacterium]
MQYAIYTRGKNVDYKWSSQESRQVVNYLNGNGIIAERQTNGQFSVYLVSEPTAEKDYQGRSISISVLVSDCPEPTAKALAVWALEKWGNYAPDFTPCVRNFGNDNWEADTAALECFVEKIKSGKSVEMTGTPFTDRFENGNNEASRSSLIGEIKKYDFSANAGFKLVADGGLMTGDNLKKLRDSLDRYLSGNGERKALPNPATVKPPQKTGNPSVLQKVFTHAACLLIGVVCCWGLVKNEPQAWWSPAKAALDNLESQLVEDAGSKLSELKKEIAEQEKTKGNNEREIERQISAIKENEKTLSAQEKQKKEFKGEMDGIAERFPSRFRKLLTKIDDVGDLNDAKEKIEERINELTPKGENALPENRNSGGQPNNGTYQRLPTQNESR